MRGRAFIDRLRNQSYLYPALEDQRQAEKTLLADAVEIADKASMAVVDTESMMERIDGVRWANTRWSAAPIEPELARALSYLDRRGLIERKAEAEHLVRFVEET